jgi:hypothetical protein
LQNAIQALYGCFRLGLKRVRIHHHPNSHVARYLNRARGALDNPTQEYWAVRTAIAQHVHRVRSSMTTVS